MCVALHYLGPCFDWQQWFQVSWGTKGGDKAEALPSILSSETKDADSSVVEDMHCIQEDVDAAFKETVTCTVTKIDGKEVIEKLVVDDQNETFCTCLVTFWMFINVVPIRIMQLDNLNFMNIILHHSGWCLIHIYSLDLSLSTQIPVQRVRELGQGLRSDCTRGLAGTAGCWITRYPNAWLTASVCRWGKWGRKEDNILFSFDNGEDAQGGKACFWPTKPFLDVC